MSCNKYNFSCKNRQFVTLKNQTCLPNEHGRKHLPQGFHYPIYSHLIQLISDGLISYQISVIPGNGNQWECNPICYDRLVYAFHHIYACTHTDIHINHILDKAFCIFNLKFCILLSTQCQTGFQFVVFFPGVLGISLLLFICFCKTLMR